MVPTANVVCLATSGSNCYNSEDDKATNIFVSMSKKVIESGLKFKRREHQESSLMPPTFPTLNKVVDEFTHLNRDYMVRSLRELHLSKGNVISLYDGIANAVLDDQGPMSWGRVVLLFALAKLMAQICFTESMLQIDTFSTHVGHFIETKTSDWIESQGGWESMYEVFCKEQEAPVIQEIAKTLAKYALKVFCYITPIPSVLLEA